MCSRVSRIRKGRACIDYQTSEVTTCFIRFALAKDEPTSCDSRGSVSCGELHTGSSACMSGALNTYDSPINRLGAASTDHH